MKILVFNAGSSSLKFELFESRGVKKNLTSLYKGHFDNHGKAIADFDKAVRDAYAELKKKKLVQDEDEIDAVGHRLVHGGEDYTKPAKITPKVLEAIKKLSMLAPLHNPPNLACIHAAQKIFPNVPHIAVFDTAFHQTMPERAYLYGLPYFLYKKFGIRRYGFHGTSHEYVFNQAREKLGVAKTRRAITCHLGNGCSLAAILNGKVIDTSMGFTPLEGVPMGTRSGDIDPAIIFHLIKSGMSAGEVEDMLNKKSGLLGVSEFSGDVRDLWAAYQKKDPRAVRALQLFAYRIAKYVGGYAVALGGLDCLVFTGGIGENAWYLRKWIMNYVKKCARPSVLVISTDEEKQIALEVIKLI